MAASAEDNPNPQNSDKKCKTVSNRVGSAPLRWLPNTVCSCHQSGLVSHAVHLQRRAAGATQTDRPKHMVKVAEWLHQVYDGRLGQPDASVNPRYVQTYGSQGLVEKVCRSNKASQTGPCAARSQATVAHKYHSTENYHDC